MRLRYQFEMMKLEDQFVAVPVGTQSGELSSVVKLNESAASIFELLMNETTEESLVNAIEKEYNGEKDYIAEEVRNVIKVLREKELLIE